MNITKETKLNDLLTEYPWLKEEIRDGCRCHYIQTDRTDQVPLMLEKKV